MTGGECEVRPGVSQNALRMLAERAARAAGTVARKFFGTDYEIRLKHDRSEVSDADEAAQVAAVAMIREERPQDAFITEETLHFAGDPPPTPSNDMVTWVIDPIDGTRNFVRHIPEYATSVAAMYGGRPRAGAVYHVERDLLYSASLGEGLFVNGHQVAGPKTLAYPPDKPRKLVVGLPSNPYGPIAKLAHRWLDNFVCRNFGSTALHLAFVAHGELDAMTADNPKLWDVAAGAVMLEIVGARLTDPDGAAVFPLDVATYAGTNLPIIAARSDVFEQVCA